MSDFPLMARTTMPSDVLSAICAHFASAHPSTRPKIGKRGARRTAVNVHWHPEVPDEVEASYTCLLCENGWNRFYISWTPAGTTVHTLRKIRRHFAEHHGIEALPLEFIASGDYMPKVEKAAWFPAAGHNNSGFFCRVCPGGAKMFVGKPLYGDGRRHAYLRFQFPGLENQLVGLTRLEQAQFLEACERGLITSAAAADTRRLLRAAKREGGIRAERSQQDEEIRAATSEMLLDLVRSGRFRQTAAIERLALLGKTDPEKFTVRVGSYIPRLRNSSDEEILTFLRKSNGEYPSYSKRTLWNIWSEIPEADREKALCAGKAVRSSNQ